MNNNLPPGWTWAPLGTLGVEVRGQVIPQAGVIYDLYSVPAFPSRSPERLNGSEIKSGKREVRFGDVLLCKINPRINRVWSVGGAEATPQIASTEYLVLRPYEHRMGRYLRQYLSSPRFRQWIELSVEGATGSHTRAKSGRILEQVLPIAPLAEQIRIVAAIEESFSRLDAAEAALRQTLKRLDTLRSSILANAFHTNRELPGGWTISTIGAVFTVIGGATPRTDNNAFWNGDIPWITPDDLSRHNDMYIADGRRSITKAGFESTSTHMLPANSVLFSSRAPIGYVAVAKNPLCTNQGFKSLIPPSNIDPRFTYWYLRYMTPQIREMGSGTTFREISKKRMSVVPFLLAPLRDQERTASAIEEQSSRIEGLQSAATMSLRKIDSLRRSVLAAAFSGRLVPQDPDDEPASVLLRRIADSQTAKPARRRERT